MQAPVIGSEIFDLIRDLRADRQRKIVLKTVPGLYFRKDQPSFIDDRLILFLSSTKTGSDGAAV